MYKCICSIYFTSNFNVTLWQNKLILMWWYYLSKDSTPFLSRDRYKFEWRTRDLILKYDPRKSLIILRFPRHYDSSLISTHWNLNGVIIVGLWSNIIILNKYWIESLKKKSFSTNNIKLTRVEYMCGSGKSRYIKLCLPVPNS